MPSFAASGSPPSSRTTAFVDTDSNQMNGRETFARASTGPATDKEIASAR